MRTLDRRQRTGVIGAAAILVIVASVAGLQGCWLAAGPSLSSPAPATEMVPLPPDILTQTQEEADLKSVGCVSCHGQPDAPTMHLSKTVRLGCADCHGGAPEVAVQASVAPGSPDYEEAKQKAHIQPRFPEAWKGPDGRYSSANRSV